MNTFKGKNMGRKIFTYLFLTLAALVSLFPFYFMFVSATCTNSQILSISPRLIFGSNLLVNLENLNKKLNLGRIFLNSMIMTVSYTSLSILFHSMAGYAFAKFEFKGKGFIFGLVMVTMMIPGQVMYVPLFTLMNKIGWANTYQAVILPGLANAFGIFLMRQNMLSFPTSLTEAARIDGYGEVGIFFRVVLPNMKPAIGALGIYMFMSMWNNFMWPLIILGTKSMYNFPVALS
ncbi:MAG: carbohydrate ABC transporter permease, partial [Hungatella sp.]